MHWTPQVRKHPTGIGWQWRIIGRDELDAFEMEMARSQRRTLRRVSAERKAARIAMWRNTANHGWIEVQP